jgi:hypothetical protein
MSDRVTWHGTHWTSFSITFLQHELTIGPTGRFLAILRAKFPLNLCSRLRFLESKHITSTNCNYYSTHLDCNCGSARGGSIGYYSTAWFNLAMLLLRYDSSKRCVCLQNIHCQLNQRCCYAFWSMHVFIRNLCQKNISSNRQHRFVQIAIISRSSCLCRISTHVKGLEIMDDVCFKKYSVGV